MHYDSAWGSWDNIIPSNKYNRDVTKKWCIDNIERENWISFGGYYSFSFKNSEDAIAFKLKFA